MRHMPLTCTQLPENLTNGYKKNQQKTAKNNFFLFKKFNQEVEKS